MGKEKHEEEAFAGHAMGCISLMVTDNNVEPFHYRNWRPIEHFAEQGVLTSNADCTCTDFVSSSKTPLHPGTLTQLSTNLFFGAMATCNNLLTIEIYLSVWSEK